MSECPQPVSSLSVNAAARKTRNSPGGRFNRAAPIRRTVGYPGLHNVSFMNSLFSGAAARAALRNATASLDELDASVGITGLAAADDSPGLMSIVDQHTAGIRDSLSVDTRPLTPVILAAYAEGVRDAAFIHGWRPPVGSIDWTSNDWVLRRLLGVCALARTLPTAS